MYQTYSNEELRRVLVADPDDTLAICEAAERFAKQVPKAENLPIDCGDAWSGFPDEGFLDGIVDRLQGLAQGMRGPNKREVQGISDALNELALGAVRNAEYGRDELRKVENALADYAENNS